MKRKNVEAWLIKNGFKKIHLMNDEWHILTADTQYTLLRDLLERTMIVKTTGITVDYDLLKRKGFIHEH